MCEGFAYNYFSLLDIHWTFLEKEFGVKSVHLVKNLMNKTLLKEQSMWSI